MRPDEFVWLWRTWFADPHGAEYPIQSSYTFELILWGAAILMAGLLLVLRPKFLDRIEANFKSFAQRRALAVVSVGLLALSVRLALLPLLPIPTPIVHDEYSYILGAQTLAAGRVTNPLHPMWVHFESFHINAWPTYQSMYPPGQAMFLAIGQFFAHQPWWGVWLSVGFMCACVTWMLQAWMPPHWALLGGLFCWMRFALFSYWVNSYWGGAVAASGGALLFGGLPRLMRKRDWRNALLVALGLLMLANTRPYEGFVAALPAMVWLLVWSLKKRVWNYTFVRQVALPMVALLALGGAWMLYYNWRGTGNPLLMPYVINERMYHISKPFMWQTRAPIPEYHHLAMRTFYCYHELPSYIQSRYWWGIENLTALKFRVYYEFMLWPMLVVMLFALMRMLRSPRARILPITLLSGLAALLVESWPPHGHYAAPVMCVAIAMALYGLRMANTWRPRKLPVGHNLVRAVAILVAVWSLCPMGARLRDPFQLDMYQRPPELERARLEAQLERTPGQHLVIVHMRRSYVPSNDWIYNEPDIDHAKVVWARDMGTQKNEELLRYYANRQVWIVDPADGIERLTAYGGHSSADTLASAVGLQPANKN